MRVGRYAKLVKAAGKAIKSEDPGAEVMLGGMWGPQSLKQGENKPAVMTYVDYMKRLYAVRGIKRFFDSLAIHPYSANIRGLIVQLRQVRELARVHRDRRIGLWITELGWASGGPPHEPYVKGHSGQAEMLGKAYSLLEQKSAALGECSGIRGAISPTAGFCATGVRTRGFATPTAQRSPPGRPSSRSPPAEAPIRRGPGRSLRRARAGPRTAAGAPRATLRATGRARGRRARRRRRRGRR